MKKLFVIFTLSVMAFTMPMKQQTLKVFTPELFGTGTMVLNRQSNGRISGHISAWGEWEIYGTVNHCFIKQVSGEPIGGAENPIACHMNFLSKNVFNGWIDFRGHPRKFCGGNVLPHKCFGA